MLPERDLLIPLLEAGVVEVIPVGNTELRRERFLVSGVPTIADAAAAAELTEMMRSRGTTIGEPDSSSNKFEPERWSCVLEFECTRVAGDGGVAS